MLWAEMGGVPFTQGTASWRDVGTAGVSWWMPTCPLTSGVLSPDGEGQTWGPVGLASAWWREALPGPCWQSSSLGHFCLGNLDFLNRSIPMLVFEQRAPE